MPVQRGIFGRPAPALPPRRMAVLLGIIAIFAVVTLVFTLPSSISPGPSLSKFTDHKISIPKLKNIPSPSILNPFRAAAHAPPVQKNSTSGESSWYSNWNWLSPFSSSVTLDENRSLLPPLADRPPIYTYYDTTVPRTKDLKEAQNAILVTWRRAWWTQGFKPIILSQAEAMNNPLYAELQMKEDLDAALKTDLTKWLAWENMGTGMLCHYLTLPMGPQEDPLLVFLRRGEFPKLTRFDNLGSGLFMGSKADITAAVKQALSNPELKAAKDFISAVPAGTFLVDSKHEVLAYYNNKTVTDKYSKVSSELVVNGAKGLQVLNQLMISHLHTTWQNIFNEGISILEPELNHMAYITNPARRLAENLAKCPESPMPTSCPPNRPKCKPCVTFSPLKISTSSRYRNSSYLYTIGTVPHPYTMALLTSLRDDIDVPWIRRKSSRDPYISTMTQELMGTGVSSAPRIIKFKEAVATDFGTAHSLWITAEEDMPKDLAWHFGFTIPRNATETGKSEATLPSSLSPEDDLVREKELLNKAILFEKASKPEEQKIKSAIEAWNLADTEAWRFARAFQARATMERQKWEDEEKKYAGSAGAERGKSTGWGRLFDD